MNRQIADFLLIKSIKIGNKRRPKPFDRPQINMTVVIKAAVRFMFLRIKAQFPIKISPALIFKNIKSHSCQKDMSLNMFK